MKAEKVILSFVAVFVGLLAAGVAFYLYQSTQIITTTPEKQTLAEKTQQPSPTPSDDNVLTIQSPADEAVFDQEVISIKGTTDPNAIITVSTAESDQVVKPAANGDFSLTQTIPDGTSIIQIVAIYPDGTEQKEIRTVTYSTESF